MLNTIFPPWPSYTVEESDAVRDVLLSNAVNYWTGNECRHFENEFADWTGSRYAVAVSNGTIALEAALNSAGIGPGDEVVVTPRTFMASVSCILMVGAMPVFADVDRNTQNITAETIDKCISPKTKAIICVHLAGMPCEMDPIMRLSEEKDLLVIEDCAQAHGAKYKGRSVGTIGHIGAWSFCQDKIMTTGGEGGMLTTNDPDFWSRMWSYKDHGKSWKAVYKKEYPLGFRWLHESIGTNGRMLEMQASIGRIQLRRMNEWTAARRENMQRILEAARTAPGLRVPNIPTWADHAAYKCYVFVEEKVLRDGWHRDRVMAAICARGVPCYSGTCPEVYKEKAITNRGLAPDYQLPVARELGDTSLMFLVHPTLTRENIDRTCEAIIEVMMEAAGSA